MLFLFHQRIIYNWKGLIKCTDHGTEFSVPGNETTSLNNLLHSSLFLNLFDYLYEQRA